MRRPSPDQALENYLEDLKQRGMTNKQLTLARHFLRHLLSTLRDLPQDGAGYRQAAGLTLRNFPEDDQFVGLLRDFFPHWNGEAPERTSAPATITPPVPKSEEVASIQVALGRMQADPWSQASLGQLERHTHQLKSLVRYQEELKKAGLEEPNIQARLMLIKLLLYTTRDVAQNTDNYRSGVDQVLTLFPQQERWHVFVSLAREFFYFLANDPAAGSKLQMQISTAELQGLLKA
ncbi:hypothetical protein [Chitinimonas naiadis]